MKNLLFILVASLCLAGCKDILGLQRGNYTFTGILYKDCNRTPIANAKIVYTTFRGTPLSPLTRSFNSETDANGRFSITENSGDLSSITIELAAPPKYQAGPVIAKLGTRPMQNDTVYGLGELYYIKRGVNVGGDIGFYTNINLTISHYYQQQDSLILGYFLNYPLIISPVPSTYKAVVEGPAGSNFFVSINERTSGNLIWTTSLQDYNKAVGASVLPKMVYKGNASLSICGNGPATDFIVDTFSHD